MNNPTISCLRHPSTSDLTSESLSMGGDDNDSHEPAPIPTVLPSFESTPLPKLAMTVLSIAMLGEFLSASVSLPFLLFMVKGFGSFISDAEVSLWTGLLVSAFFLTQFLTSLLWASIAEKYGRKLVPVVSLLGGAIICSSFGATTSLWPAISIRLLQGVFAGAIGVVRGSVSWVTDTTNEGRAYSILGFCWGVGGIVGSVIGGTFEHPAVRWSSIFARVPLFVDYPYLFPCVIAGSIMFTGMSLSLELRVLPGAVLASFLESDTTISEDSEKFEIDIGQVDETTPILNNNNASQYSVGSMRFPNALESGTSVPFERTQTMSSDGTRRVIPIPRTIAIESTSTSPSTGRWEVSLHRSVTTDRTISGCRGSSMHRTVTIDSNTGIGRRGRGVSMQRTVTLDSASIGLRSRRLHGRSATNTRSFKRISTISTNSDLSLARKFLLAHENTVSSMADLWVAAAMNVDDDVDYDFEFDNDREDEVDNLGYEGGQSEDGGSLLCGNLQR